MTLRVLTISKPYVAKSYRSKFRILAEMPEFEIGVICPQKWGHQSFEADEHSPNYKTYLLPITFNGHHHWHFYRNLLATIKTFKPDLLNVEEEHYSIVTAQAVHWARKSGIKTLFYSWQNIFKRYPPPFHQIESFVFKNCAAGIVGNLEAKQVLIKKGFSKPIYHVPQMGVDIDDSFNFKKDKLLYKNTLNLNPDFFWVGYVGRIIKEKGIETLIKAVTKLGNKKIGLIVIGSGDQQSAIKRLLAQHLHPDRYRMIAQLPSFEVPNYLKAIDAICLPSLTRPNWKEQFGRILIEAMAFGCVTIGSNSGEIPNVIQDAGLIFPEGNDESLKRAIEQLIQSNELVLKLQAKGFDRVQAHFSNNIIAGRFAKIFLDTAKYS